MVPSPRRQPTTPSAPSSSTTAVRRRGRRGAARHGPCATFFMVSAMWAPMFLFFISRPLLIEFRTKSTVATDKLSFTSSFSVQSDAPKPPRTKQRISAGQKGSMEDKLKDTTTTATNHDKTPSDDDTTRQLPPPNIHHYCNLTGVDDWLMSSNATTTNDDWQRRTPGFLIVGAKKAGTTALFDTLLGHPHVVAGSAKELQFFIPHKKASGFAKYWSQNNGTVVQVAEARRALQQRHFGKVRLQLQHNARLVAAEATPDYLMFPHGAAQAILCTLPWIQLVVVLRDPIDRLYSHFNYLQDPDKGTHRPDLIQSSISFEEWVRGDVAVLQQVGILPKNLSETRPPAAEEEEAAWRRYERLKKPGRHTPGSDRHVCRSLYAPQLEIWKRQLQRILGDEDLGRRVKVVWSRELANATTGPAVVRDLVRWLGLDPALLPNHGAPVRSMVTHYTTPPVRPAFRAWLRDTLFAPYNQRLYQFLGPQYQGIFDK